MPVNDDGGFAFLPVGPNNGPFTHFFLLSPFDGAGFVQFCGSVFPLTRVIGTPVFFVTAPVTLGTILLGCTPGIVFTPFQAGIGQLNPIFFPIGATGPGFFAGGGHHGRRHPLSPGYGSMPVYRSAPAVPAPTRRAPVMPMPINRAPVMPMPNNRAPVMPMPVHRSPVIRSPHVPVRCCTHAR